MQFHFEILEPSMMSPSVLAAVVSALVVLAAWYREAKTLPVRQVSVEASSHQTGRTSTRDSHWDRVFAIVDASVSSADSAAEFHTAALNRIEATAYALQQLKAELTGVMAIPMGIEAAPVAEVIGRIEPAPRQPEIPAIAA